MEKTAMRIRARAIRRCGELLKEIEKTPPQISGAMKGGVAADTTLITRKDAAEDAGLSKRQAVTAIRVANVPNEIFTD
jgi:hypothetical protein